MHTAERVPSFWRLQAAGWLAFGVAMATSRIGLLPITYMVSAKIVLTLLGFLTSLMLWRLYRRMFARGVSVPETIAVCAVASYLAACVWTLAFNLIDVWIQPVFLARPDVIRGVFGLFVGSVYHAFALFGWSVLYFAIKHYEALQTERERSLRAEALAQTARLEALRYQLNPHFLFNTLNAISTLVVDQRGDDAARMLSRLSDFLRTTLDGTAPEVSLTEEIDVVRRYLEIEQVRFGDRLSVSYDVQPEAWGAAVPAFVLQPLVENAVHHAIAQCVNGGHITISARRSSGRLLVTILDDGPGLNARHSGRNGHGGIGIANTRERLVQLYGDAHRLSIESGAVSGVEASIELPFRMVGSA